jgi:DNA-binding IclR family transcriptional regulator
LLHGIQCLQWLASAGRPVGSRELSRLLRVEHTRVNRALGTLQELGLAARTADRKYRPGPALHVFAAQSLRGSGLLAAALPHLRELHGENLTVALGVLWEKQVCYLVHARPGQAMDESIGRHELWPAETSSLGLVLLAATKGSLSRTATRLAPEAAHPLSAPAEYLSTVRQYGSARLRFADGTVSIAVPVGDPVIAAFGVSCPSVPP